MDVQYERALGRLEGKVDSILDAISELKDYRNQLDARFAKVESWQTRASGYLAGGAAALAAIFEFVKTLLNHVG